MPSNIKSESVTMTTIERTWRIIVAMTTDPTVTADREVVNTAGGEVIGRKQTGSIERSISAAGDYPVTVPGTDTVLTLSQLVAALASATDTWAAEDHEEGVSSAGPPIAPPPSLKPPQSKPVA